MNFYKGSLNATFDINILGQAIQDPTASPIYVGDPVGDEQLINQYNLIVATVLLPSYDTMAADIEGDPKEFMARYTNDIMNNKAAFDFICTIITAIHKGKNVVLYFPHSSNGLKYPGALLEIFSSMFGLAAANEDNAQFMAHPAFIRQNVNHIYGLSLISPEEYLYYTPCFMDMIDKLVYDLGIMVENPDKLYDYFAGYQKDMHMKQAILKKPFARRV